MKKMLFFLGVVTLSSQGMFAQSKVQAFYVDKNDRLVENRDSAYYIRNIQSSYSRIEIEEFYLNGNRKQIMPAISVGTGNSEGLNEEWHENGNIKSQVRIIGGVPQDEYKEWYENGQLKIQVSYKNGLFNGEALSYFSDGKIKRRSVFEKGKEVESKCYEDNGKIEICGNTHIKTATFKGGYDKLISYLSRNLKYPKNAQRQGVRGNVYLGFVVDRQGSIRDVHVVRSANEELDAEALRVVKTMPDWEPGIIDGELVNVWFVLPISFR